MDRLTINELREVAKKSLPAGSSLWLYGSRARGEAHADSDWDLLVLVNKSAIETDDFKNICYPLVLAGWQHGADVNPQLYTKGEWDKRRFTPYFDNVEHDKLVIYES